MEIFMSKPDASRAYLQRLDRDISQKNQVVNTNGMGTDYLTTRDTGKFIASEKRISALEIQEREDTLLQSRNKRTEDQLMTVQRIGQDLQSLLMGANSLNGITHSAFENRVERLLNEMESVMNNGFGEDQTLSGIALRTPAVTLTGIKAAVATDEISYDYYNGESGDLSISLSKDASINLYPLTGKDNAFAKIIHAARLSLNIDPNNPDTDIYRKAKDLCAEAIATDIPNALHRVSSERHTIDHTLKEIPSLKQRELDQFTNQGIEDTIASLISLEHLKSSKQITQSIAIQQAQLSRKFADELTRGF